jgi:hypothetical protein
MSTKSGLFIASYNITTGLAGAPNFEVHLTVNTVNRVVTGLGEVTQAVHPPLDVQTSLKGDFTYLTVMPDNTHILVVLQGSGESSPITPAEIINTKLRMLLDKGWQSGVASFSYFANGQWNNIEDAKVTIIKQK